MKNHRPAKINVEDLRKENLRRSARAGVPAGATPEPFVDWREQKRKVKKSRRNAVAVQKKQLSSLLQGGRVNPR